MRASRVCLAVTVLFFSVSPVRCGGGRGGERKGGVWGRAVSATRRLLQLGVTDDSRAVPPVFVQWAHPRTQPRCAYHPPSHLQHPPDEAHPSCPFHTPLREPRHTFMVGGERVEDDGRGREGIFKEVWE